MLPVAADLNRFGAGLSPAATPAFLNGPLNEASRTARIEKSLKSVMRRRNLLLALVGNEIERLCVWYNPRATPDKQLPGETTVVQWRQSTLRDVRTEGRLMRDSARIAWQISPALAVHLLARFKV
jgi:hypothetical protein